MGCEELCPAETRRRRRPRLAPGHELRIRNDAKGHPPEHIRRVLFADEVHHVASLAYTLRDVTLHGGAYFAGMHKGDLFRAEPPRGPADVEYRERAVLASTYAATRWFGHLLHDDFPLQLLAEQLGPPVAHARAIYRHEREYRRVFGVGEPAWHRGLLVGELIVLVDHAQNASKRARYEAMRRALFRGSAGARRTRVYIRRTGGEARQAEGEPQLIEALVRRGFEVVNKAVDPVDRVVALCTSSTQIVGIDGSHMVPPTLLAPSDAEVVTLLPGCRAEHILNDLTDALSLRSAIYVCEQQDPSIPMQIDVDDAVRFIDAGVQGDG